ncbi:hypothetical protein RHGRI_014682 [Rhododendron griersonianum]|uniref:Rx N-terminal domain-containing protein n=1 Tax=Rhododendron griersonianum TaxID=479676 RepID=A0AAV6KAH7_9ERIC|nr:hypothetical protein RHGRI_014682 [Rhododendron griersonianum]
MAEAILSIIAEKAAVIAASQIIKESSRLSRVREDLDWIVSEMRYIQSYLKDVDAKQLRTNVVSNFIRDIWDLAYDVEDIIDTYFPKIRLSRSRWKRLLDFTNMRIARGFVKEVQFSLLSIGEDQMDIKNICDSLGIRLISYSPLGLGMLTGKYTPSNLPRGPRGQIIPGLEPLLNSLREIAQRRQKTVPQVMYNAFGVRLHGGRQAETFYGLPGHLFKADWLRKLTSLRTLQVNLVDKDIIGVLSDAAPVSHKLEELSLFGKVLHLPETTSLNFSRYENLSELLIKGVRLSELPHDKLPPNLAKLILVMTHSTTDPTEALKKLQKLKFLKLGSRSYAGKELVCSGELGNFPQLEVLEIVYLPNLERVVVEEGGMPRLRDFCIVDCNPETRIPDGVRNVMRTVKTNNSYRFEDRKDQ